MINVTIVGFGYVGSSLLLLLLSNQRSLRLNVMEPNEQSEGAFLDLAHVMSLYPNKELFVNDEQLFAEADFIFFAAGIPNDYGESRLSIAQQNIQLSRDIFEHRKFAKKPYVVVITNPVDVISYYVHQFTGLPAERVIGIGTFLDSKRLSFYLSSISQYKANDFDAFVLGEHGASQVPIYSMTKLKEKPILTYPEFTDKKLEKAQILTEAAAWEIRKTQDGTSYGVSKCAEIILDCILGQEDRLLTLSMQTNDYYRSQLQLDKNIFIGMPVMIKNGILEIKNDIQFLEKEWEAYRKSASILRENMQ